MSGETYGQIAYEAYRDHSGGKSLVSGAVLPDWDKLSAEIKDAWFGAAGAVAVVVLDDRT